MQHGSITRCVWSAPLQAAESTDAVLKAAHCDAISDITEGQGSLGDRRRESQNSRDSDSDRTGKEHRDLQGIPEHSPVLAMTLPPARKSRKSRRICLSFSPPFARPGSQSNEMQVGPPRRPRLAQQAWAPEREEKEEREEREKEIIRPCESWVGSTGDSGPA